MELYKQNSLFNEVVLSHKLEIQNFVLSEVSAVKISRQHTIEKDIESILAAIQKDIKFNSTKDISLVGFSYVYFHKGVTFTARKAELLTIVAAIENILTRLIDDQLLLNAVILRTSLLTELLNEKTIVEVKLWDYVARTAPYLALVLLIFFELFKNEIMISGQYVAIAVIIGFFTAGVSWWWWATWKIASIFIFVKRAYKNFIDVRTELIEVKKEIDKDFEH